MMSQLGKQTTIIHILPNITRRNIRNIFLKKYTKCGEETIPRLFSKIVKIEHIIGSAV